ncbi:MAG: hypothetical protein LBJ73_03795 [Rickettsiales bacterium]|jgi:hypothetical protein|nr:hypothetical protein [Rickettsiales bacterium]
MDKINKLHELAAKRPTDFIFKFHMNLLTEDLLGKQKNDFYEEFIETIVYIGEYHSIASFFENDSIMIMKIIEAFANKFGREEFKAHLVGAEGFSEKQASDMIKKSVYVSNVVNGSGLISKLARKILCWNR